MGLADRRDRDRVLMEKKCKIAAKCGGCSWQGISYPDQLQKKTKLVKSLLGEFCPVHPVIGMEQPYHYRNKVHAVFSRRRNGEIISGTYERGSHRVVPVETCLIEDPECDRIIGTIRSLLPSFRIRVYDEDSGYGLLRHVLIRKGFRTGQILVTLVVTSPIFPSKNNFVKALRKAHPEITSLVLNINDKKTSMVLGERNILLYGKGYIEDILCGKVFRISPRSFYQINPVQTDLLYKKAVELAGLTGQERVLDAYCGIGTIGLVASDHAGEIIGVELNPDAVRDAISNARRNKVENARFYTGDAGRFMENMAAQGQRIDVLFLDPPRSGSDETFLSSAARMKPERMVYISCNPKTQARDLKFLQKKGYLAQEAWAYDCYPWTEHVETIVAMSGDR